MTVPEIERVSARKYPNSCPCLATLWVLHTQCWHWLHHCTVWSVRLWKRFVKKVFWEFHRPQGCTAAAVLPEQARETFRKHFIKPFSQPGAPDCKSTKWNLHTRHVSKLKKVRPIRTPRSLLCSCVRYGSPTRPVGRSVTERIDRAGKTSVFCPRESRFLHEEETEREREKWDSIA